jgi:hypothetical protein
LLRTSHFYPNWETPFSFSTGRPATEELHLILLGRKTIARLEFPQHTPRDSVACSESIESGLFRGEGGGFLHGGVFLMVPGQQVLSSLFFPFVV